MKNLNMVRDNSEHIEDGAGDAMLATSEKEQLALGNEVKFIPAEQKNGDAKIDIVNIEKVSAEFGYLKKPNLGTKANCLTLFGIANGDDVYRVTCAQYSQTR